MDKARENILKDLRKRHNLDYKLNVGDEWLENVNIVEEKQKIGQVNFQSV